MTYQDNDQQSKRDPKPEEPKTWVDRYRWTVFGLPFLVYMIVGTFEPTPTTVGGKSLGMAIPYSGYPLIYTLKLGLTIATMLAVWPGYRRFPLRISPWSVLVGLFGVVLWIGLCEMNLERTYLAPYGFGWLVDTGERSAFNPLEQISDPQIGFLFLAIRLLGIAIVVPVIEEFFLRGFVMRYVIDGDTWWNLPIGTLTPMAAIVGTLLPMFMHPGELLAAAVWFSMITYLMVRTKNLWDCVVAHAVTNLLLAIFVIATGKWYLM